MRCEPNDREAHETVFSCFHLRNLAKVRLELGEVLRKAFCKNMLLFALAFVLVSAKLPST